MEEQTSSGVGVLDKAALVLSALEAGPATLAQLVSSTGLARPTAHRLAVALEYHRMVARDMQGRFILGPRLQELSSAAGEDRLLQASMPVLQALRDHTKESSQLFRRQGDYRVCVAASEREMGLRDSIPVGATLSMSAGSAAQVLLAWEDQNRIIEGLRDAHFSAAMLAAVRRIGWAQSVGERERGTIEHLLVMPVNAFELMMGKVLANAAVIWVAALSSLWFIVHLSIGVPLIGSVPLYAVGLALFLFSVASLGIMIATFASTMGQFGMLMLPVYIVMNLFAGGASPRSNMPHAAQLISEYWPLTQFVKFSQDILFRGAGIEIVWGHMLIMGCIGVGFLWLALLRFQGMLERQG